MEAHIDGLSSDTISSDSLSSALSAFSSSSSACASDAHSHEFLFHASPTSLGNRMGSYPTNINESRCRWDSGIRYVSFHHPILLLLLFPSFRILRSLGSTEFQIPYYYGSLPLYRFTYSSLHSSHSFSIIHQTIASLTPIPLPSPMYPPTAVTSL